MDNDKPNIIMIVSDQHRGDWMGCSGSKIVHTPNLDRMANEGVHFTQAYCNSPLCVPSRMSMLSGRYPHHTKVYTNNDHLASDIPTFAHALGLGGYETVLCGRMHFLGPDQRHGYQKRLVGDVTPCYLGGPGTPYGELGGTSGQGLASITKAGPGTSPVLRYDERVISTCERFLEERSSDSSRPLFLSVCFYGPHHPYTCPPDLYEQALDAMEKYDTPIPRDELPRHPWIHDWFERLQADEITPEQLKVARACYAGLITLVDSYVGRILRAAKSLPGPTWIVYVSDHGDMAGDRGMFWKRNFFEGAVRVPMIWYKQVQKNPNKTYGRRVDFPVSLIDLAPTLVNLSKSPKMMGLDGEDISCLLEDELDIDREYWRRRPVFAELVNSADSATRMIIKDNMKLIAHHGFDPVRMFDLKKDPLEQQDLAQKQEFQEIRDNLLAMLMADWDPEQALRDSNAKEQDHNYLRKWGEQVGMEQSDLWDYNG